MELTKGSIIVARTHAELLNKVFGTNYDSWMKSTYDYNYNTTVWMIAIDKEFRSGFCNYFDENNNIIEYSKTKNTRSLKDYRLVFEIDKSGAYRKYIYHGKYKIDRSTIYTDKRKFVPVD